MPLVVIHLAIGLALLAVCTLVGNILLDPRC